MRNELHGINDFNGWMAAAALFFLCAIGGVLWQPSIAFAQAPAIAPVYSAIISETVTPALPEIEFPDLSGYSHASIVAQLPDAYAGTASLATTDDENCLSECFGGKLRKGFEAMQGTTDTQVIKVNDGAVTLAEVVRQINDPTIATMTGKVATLRVPLLVSSGATLVVRGSEIEQVRLATNRGVFIANQGTMFIVDTAITSWDEETQRSTPCADGGKTFRSFVTSYSGSMTYLAGSTFRDLGYLSPSAYGFCLTSHPERDMPEASGAWPTGTIVDCTFEGLFYGFYSFEARDVAIVGNKYVDNIRYGIDPHDRSTRLIIAKNSVTGTKEKHGIIGSRNVTDSFIFDNDSRNNVGTGIMLDRQCSRVVIANNRVVDNQDTGIAVFESCDNQIVNNLIAFNGGNGFRVRNSQQLLLHSNQIVGNEGFAVTCESKPLDDHQKRLDRGDTYDPKIELSVFSNALVANMDGMFKGRGVTSLKVSNVLADVDMKAVNALIGGEERSLDMEDDDPLGGDLEEFLREFDSVMDSEKHILEISAG